MINIRDRVYAVEQKFYSSGEMTAKKITVAGTQAISRFLEVETYDKNVTYFDTKEGMNDFYNSVNKG